MSNTSGKPALRPNPSLKLTRYGMRCKPGLRHTVHHLSPGLQHMPPAGSLARTLGVAAHASVPSAADEDNRHTALLRCRA